MTKEEALKEIEERRIKIDELDRQLVDLLNKRAEQSIAIRFLKPDAGMQLYDPEREGMIFEKLEAYNNGPMHAEDVHEIYETLLKVMKAIKA